MLVLGIETSCDETSFALLEGNGGEHDSFFQYINSFNVRSSIISSQIEKHIQYGGIVPEIGARLHAQQIHYLFQLLLQNSSKPEHNAITIGIVDDITDTLDAVAYLPILKQLEAIYVTTQPGLASALRVGHEFAKSLQYFIAQLTGNVIEIVEVNHLHGHIVSCFYQQNSATNPRDELFPHLHLIVSGGNSQLLLLKNPEDVEIIGQTLDDAAGECLDKVGRMLGFPYPGGLNLAKVAGIEEHNSLNFPIGMNKNTTLNYSFSGLKTAVRLFLEQHAPTGFVFEEPLTSQEIDLLQKFPEAELPVKLAFIKIVAISVQTVVIKQLTNKLKKAIHMHEPVSTGLSGGVSANLLLRKNVSQITQNRILIPALSLTGDNAVMIALAGLAKNYTKNGLNKAHGI
jgi:N6-L-threonylcarbamoyladenine synthase